MSAREPWGLGTKLALVSVAIALSTSSAALGCRFLSAARAPDRAPTGAQNEPVFDLDNLGRSLKAEMAAYTARTGRTQFKRRIVIDKAAHRLDVYADATVLKSYVINLGLSPVEPKRAAGDRKTPEGEMYVCSSHPQSPYHRFLGLSYPTPDDAERGFRTGLVDARVRDATLVAYHHRDRCPPQDSALGGAVGIHGGGGFSFERGRLALSNWTWGCIALRNRDMDEIFDDYAAIGTPVLIRGETDPARVGAP
jgi:hypothetical protein